MAVLGGTTLGGIVEAIRYRRQNRSLKENEVKKDDVETQRGQINLAEEYMKKVMELSEMNYQQALKNGSDNESIIKKVDEIATMQGHIVTYLNGEFDEYLKRKGFTA